MAKIVIAGRADCPYFARVELIGDYLMKNLPAFNLHKIVKTPGEWPSWLVEVCAQNGWSHETSPLIWRELLDRGGKAKLIGGSNEFQEYVKGYYGYQSDMTTDDMLSIRLENLRMKQEIDQEEAYYRELTKPIYVCITAAESPVCYSLITPLVSGEVFGLGTHITLRLLTSDTKKMSMVKALAMEALDLCSLQLRSVEVMDSTVEAFKNCSVIIMLDELLQQPDEDRSLWIWRNYFLFSAYARQLNHEALRGVRVLVAGSGPVNFNTMVVINTAPRMFRHNIVGLSQEVESRAKAILARKLKVSACQMADLVLWGNVNGQRYIDTTRTKVFDYEGAIRGPPYYHESAVEKLHDKKWLDKELPFLLDKRGSEVEGALRHAACASAAIAISSTLNHLLNGSPPDRIFSLAVYSEGWYDVPHGLVFSFPVMMSPRGHWTVVQDMQRTPQEEMSLMDAITDVIREAEVLYPAYHDFLVAAVQRHCIHCVCVAQDMIREAEDVIREAEVLYPAYHDFLVDTVQRHCMHCVCVCVAQDVIREAEVLHPAYHDFLVATVQRHCMHCVCVCVAQDVIREAEVLYPVYHDFLDTLEQEKKRVDQLTQEQAADEFVDELQERVSDF
ncbi:hypothetical protein ACOMHN_018503 [Nucella lapillus]